MNSPNELSDDAPFARMAELTLEGADLVAQAKRGAIAVSFTKDQAHALTRDITGEIARLTALVEQGKASRPLALLFGQRAHRLCEAILDVFGNPQSEV